MWLIILAVFVGLQAINGLGQARMLAWLQPAADHLNRAVALVQQGASAEAVAECDKALELIPEGHKLRDNAYACRAMAVAQLSQAAATICPKCSAALKPPVTPGADACWNCGWSSRTA